MNLLYRHIHSKSIINISWILPSLFCRICISLEFYDWFPRFIALFWPTLTDRHLFFPVTHWSLYSLHFGHFLSDTFFLFSFLYFTFSGFGTKVKRNQKKNFQKRWFYLKRYYILHYFDPANVGSFLLVSLLGLILVLALVLLIAKLQIQRQLKEETEEKRKKYAGRNTSAGSIRLWKAFMSWFSPALRFFSSSPSTTLSTSVCRRFRCTGRSIRMWCFLSLSCSPSFWQAGSMWFS